MPNTEPAIKKIQIRNKAKTLKGHCNEDTLVAAIRQFLKMQPEDAFNLLWRLKYIPAEAKDNILKELGLSLKMVPNLSLLESELGYQYRHHVDATFLKPPKQSGMTEAVLRAFNALYEAPELGHCTAIYVYRACVAYQSMANADIGRVQYLLGRSEENCFFGGIQELLKAVCPKLDERKVISNYLKPHAVKILELFTALTEEEKKPMSQLLDQIKNIGNDLPPAPTDTDTTKKAPVEEDPANEAPAEESVPTTQPITPESVDANRPVIEALLDAARKARQCGFDPAAILAAEPIIQRHWEAQEALKASVAAFATFST